ncbi:HD domain-containing protein [Krasilnikovia sp. MM14-A1004]|uniref:HD domain-containing protein n=1 Tax=Krasilnikovia sp. MM14-A1004 TaxID=3373541 RepID=UPI00399D36B6
MSLALTTLADAAQQTAYALLGGMGARWRHSRGVARRAAELAGPLGIDADLLVAAAWLHDIGYAPPAVVTGFHPLDGAGYLAARRWPPRVAGLVAYHSGAVFVAAARGLGGALAAFADEGGAVADALTYADQTVGPEGQRVTLADRRTEMLCRHGAHSWNALVDHVRWPHLRALAERVERRLVTAEPVRSAFDGVAVPV